MPSGPQIEVPETLKFNPIVGEKERVYIYSDGRNITIPNVSLICVRPSGNHRLECADGTRYIVAAGWKAIRIVADQWTV